MDEAGAELAGAAGLAGALPFRTGLHLVCQAWLILRLMQGHKCTLSNVGEKPRWTKPRFPVFQPLLKKRFWDSEVWNSELVLGKQAVSLGRRNKGLRECRKLTPRLEWQQQAHDNFAILQYALFPSGQVDSLQNLMFYRVFILCRITKYPRHDQKELQKRRGAPLELHLCVGVDQGGSALPAPYRGI